MTNHRSTRLFATALSALTLAAGSAQAAPLPPLHERGGVEYLSGGIGHDEAVAIESSAAHWPLALEFAVKDGPRADFVADVKVHVRDAEGRTALDAVARGPFLLARLAPGSYRVDATFAGETLHEKVLVTAAHSAKAVFVWPSGTDAASHHAHA